LGPKTLFFLSTVYTLAVTVTFLMPVSEGPSWDIPYLDKWVHVLFHALLALFWLSTLYAADKNHFSSRWLSLALVICFFYGIAIEAFQHWFTSTRTFDLVDILANGIGELAGLVAFKVVRKRL
jgi:VanZ family protein